MNDEPSFHTSLEECDTLPLIFFRARSTFVLDATKVMFGLAHPSTINLLNPSTTTSSNSLLPTYRVFE